VGELESIQKIRSFTIAVKGAVYVTVFSKYATNSYAKRPLHYYFIGYGNLKMFRGSC
jgi:hypothetical protein